MLGLIIIDHIRKRKSSIFGKFLCDCTPAESMITSCDLSEDNMADITALNTLNAPGAAFQVYATLCAFAMRKDWCFPSLKTLGEVLPSMNRRTIQRALKWLEDNKFIRRGRARTRDRFKLLKRTASAFVSAIVKGQSTAGKGAAPVTPQQRHQDRPNTKRKRKTNNYRHKRRSHQKKILSEAQILGESITMLVSGENTWVGLTEAARDLIRADISKGFDKDGHINWSYYPEIVSQAAR